MWNRTFWWTHTAFQSTFPFQFGRGNLLYLTLMCIPSSVGSHFKRSTSKLLANKILYLKVWQTLLVSISYSWQPGLNYQLVNVQLIIHLFSCKYLGIIVRSDLSWADHVNYTVKKAWKALHFTMRILRKGNSNTKRLAYTSLVRPILEYGAACWDPYREGQIRELDRVQRKVGKFAQNTNRTSWETLASRRKIARLCGLYKAYRGERAWEGIGDRLERHTI